jgi:hypothetical protein
MMARGLYNTEHRLVDYHDGLTEMSMKRLFLRLTPKFTTPPLTLLLALVLFDVFLICAAERVGIGRPAEQYPHVASLTVPEDGKDRLVDQLRHPELLAFEPSVFADCQHSECFETVTPSGPRPLEPTGAHTFPHLPLHLCLCVWLI